MKPVAVFQHTQLGAPGSVLPILQTLGRETRVIRVFEGEAIPDDPSAFCGLVFLGGSMGVDDGLAWIGQELALIRSAALLGLPLAGHCLGSQLIAKALGGQVAPHTVAELGWQELQAEDHPVAQHWWGPLQGGRLPAFQWHFDTFVPPPGAVRIASGPHCESQAYVLHGRHLLLQSHLEMTPTLVELWWQKNGHQLVRQHQQGNPAASAPADLMARLDTRTSLMRKMLRQLYAQWVTGCGH